jgi:cytochrome b involved in lipid metabolism
MRRLYLSSTIAFWLLVTAFWAGSLWLPPAADSIGLAAEKSYSKADLARHATPGDCWMAIRGNVHDLSAYLPEHPSRPEMIEPWCGKEATDAYSTKTRGRPHTPYADGLLVKYRIGTFAADKP